MSYSNALKTVDFLLEILSEADKAAPQNESQSKAQAPVEEIKEGEYFQSVEDDGVVEGQTVKVTLNAKRFDEMWDEAELGVNDDKKMYLGAVGKVMEIEEDDDTVQLRWANYDTCWIPIKACVSSNGAEPT
eukprot:CAMPEP_0197033234 /NCGR_PEP_ID=MMETSP1384-20130603/11700_1 /TAXON_ID=29189 /ORGANISM="Ammonia sp." /LENGTH=130 /DNA_ID=CAMNT_0042463017 /DNA_START=74 /DNA_END=462 /DNA_ORIENTATION=+